MGFLWFGFSEKRLAKRLEKLKPLIWNNHHDFWFFVFKKPEDIGLICLDYMIKYKILKNETY